MFGFHFEFFLLLRCQSSLYFIILFSFEHIQHFLYLSVMLSRWHMTRQIFVIEVAHFRNVLDVASWHVENWLLQCLTVHDIEVLTISVSKMPILYLKEQGCKETSNWTHKILGFLWERGTIDRWVVKRAPNSVSTFIVVCVDDPILLFLLIEWTYQSEYLSPNQLIIPINWD